MDRNEDVKFYKWRSSKTEYWKKMHFEVKNFTMYFLLSMCHLYGLWLIIYATTRLSAHKL